MIELTNAHYVSIIAYWWTMGALCGIGIGAWLQKKLTRKP